MLSWFSLDRLLIYADDRLVRTRCLSVPSHHQGSPGAIGLPGLVGFPGAGLQGDKVPMIDYLISTHFLSNGCILDLAVLHVFDIRATRVLLDSLVQEDHMELESLDQRLWRQFKGKM